MRGLLVQSISWLLVCVSLGTTAQILLRLGLKAHGTIGSLGGLVGAFKNWQVLVGFGLYGVSSLLYITIISRVPVSFAYPFIALTYIGVAILARLLPQLRENIPPLHVVGLTLIFIGVSLIGIAQSRERAKAAKPTPPLNAAVKQ